MPPFPVRRTTYLLRRNLKHLVWLAGSAALATAFLTIFILVTSLTLTAGILCTGLAVYVGRYVYFLLRGRQSHRQLKLESRFMRQPLDKAPLAACIKGDGNDLWSGSHTCEALQRALQLPMPRLMLYEEKLERLHRFFRLAYRPLRLRALRVHLYTLAATSATAVLFFLMSPAAELVQLSGMLLIVITCFEGVLWYQRSKVRRQLNAYLRGLSRWTLNERQGGTLRDDLHKPYQHNLLYNSPRWFSPSEEVDLERAA